VLFLGYAPAPARPSGLRLPWRSTMQRRVVVKKSRSASRPFQSLEAFGAGLFADLKQRSPVVAVLFAFVTRLEAEVAPLCQDGTTKMRMTLTILAAIAALSAGASTASAQSNQGAMKGMDHSAMPGMKGAKGDHNMMAMNDYMAAMKKMDQAMMSAKGSTPDATFARKMMAHHQGAIDMAQIQLRHGADADAKKIAQKTIDENTKSKAELEAWLKSHGG